MIKRMIRRGVLFFTMCVLSVYFSCDSDDDDDHHHHDPNASYSSLWRQQRHKEYQVRLSSEISPVFDNAYLRNSAPAATGPNDFTAGIW